MASSRLLVFLCVILLVNVCLAVGPPIWINPNPEVPSPLEATSTERASIAWLNPNPEEPCPFCRNGYTRLVGINVFKMDRETFYEICPGFVSCELLKT